MLCYSCCLVTVPGHANCQIAAALAIAYGAQICAGFKLVTTQAMIEEQAAELTDSDTDYDEN